MHMRNFPSEKNNVKLAYTYWGRTKIYFLKWGRRTKSLRNPDLNKSILVGTYKQFYFNFFFFLVLTVCFVYRTRQKSIKNLKNKYEK